MILYFESYYLEEVDNCDSYYFVLGFYLDEFIFTLKENIKFLNYQIFYKINK